MPCSDGMRRPNRAKRLGIFAIFIGLVFLFVTLYRKAPSQIYSRKAIVAQSDIRIIDVNHELSDLSPWAQRFFLCWTTKADTWKERHDWMIQLLLLHHPDAQLVVLAEFLPDDFFDAYVQRGYSVRIIRVTVDYLLKQGWTAGPNTAGWLTRLEEWRASPANTFYSHFTDYLRFITLIKFGGTYLDMDALLLRPIQWQQFIGLDFAGEIHGATPAWLFEIEEHAALTGVRHDVRPMLDRPPGGLALYLAPGVMRFGPGQTFLIEAMETAFDPKTYSPSCWNCVGPRVITDAYRAASTTLRGSITIPPWYEFFPLPYTGQRLTHSVQPNALALAQQLVDRSTSLHLFGKMSMKMSVESGSALDHLTRTIFPLRAMWRKDVCMTGIAAPDVYVHTAAKLGLFQGRDVLAIWGCTSTKSQILTLRVEHGSLAWGKSDTGHRLTAPAGHTIAQLNAMLADLRYQSPHDARIARDIITITYGDDSGVVERAVQVVIFHRAVTLITKTMDRLDKVCLLLRSFWRYFPSTPAIVVNDGERASTERALPCAESSCVDFECVSLQYVAVPYDLGLSASRNRLVSMAQSEFVFYSDDDFELDWDSRLEVLLEHLIQYNADIAAGKIPEAGHDYSGTINIVDAGTTLQLDPAPIETIGACQRVDFVPNVFMARRTSLAFVQWDPDLKLGEHEDFFMRAQQQQLRVLTCAYVNVHHRQENWENSEDDYARKRKRVYSFFDIMLRKHRLKRFITFGGAIVRQLEERASVNVEQV